jgi:heavy metal sensor kinase
MKPGSIRLRLTAWYFVVLALGLSLFGVGAWFAMRESLYHAVDQSLSDRVRGVQRFMNAQISALSLIEIRDEFREHSVLGPGGDLFQVCDGEGQWLYRSTPLEDRQIGIRKPDQIGDAAIYEDSAIETTPVRFLSQRVVVNGKPYTVQVAAPVGEILLALRRFQWTLLLSIPLLLAIASGAGYWISRRALEPVDRITRAARSISIQNLSDRLETPSTGDELQRLSETLNEMLARLDGAVRRMMQFTADASHELRAPIALIRTTAEVSLRKERSAADYQEAMTQVLAESEKMSHLVESLLLLARADSGADGLRMEPIDMAASAREACDEGRTLAAAKQIRMDADIPAHPVTIQGDAQAIRRLFLILIDNAVKYTPAGGWVRVGVEPRDGVVVGTVSDSGIGIAEADLPHVFDRFWRADKVRSREMGGSGLGLSIAKWIAARHGGVIEVASAVGQGSVFRVLAPRIQ